MSERTKLGLGIARVAIMFGRPGDGLLRATPWGLDVLLFPLALVGYAASLATRRDVGLRVEAGKELDAPYLNSPSADGAVPPLLAGLPRLPKRDRRAVEAGIKALWAGPTPGGWRIYNLPRFRARETVAAGLPLEMRDPRGDE